MCRIFGVSYGDTPEDLSPGEIAERLFPAFVEGGPHAYGYMQYQDGEGITFDKWEGRADTEQALDRAYYGIKDDARWFVGHLRFFTLGSPSNPNNNHPIPHGRILGVHNGVLDNHNDILRNTGREDEDTQVDSEAIFAAVNKWGPKKGLRKIKGKMVAVFVDARTPDRIRIARSHSRSLFVGWTKKGNMIFGSEKLPLEELSIDSEIEFTKFSNVGEYRLLTIQNGLITQRGTYLSTEQLVHAQAATVLRQLQQSKRLEPDVKTSDDQTYDSWLAERSASRAMRRGEMMFGPGDQMMSTEEYLELLADQEEDTLEIEQVREILAESP
jgi:predicted glutamine amidotransferase